METNITQKIESAGIKQFKLISTPIKLQSGAQELAWSEPWADRVVTNTNNPVYAPFHFYYNKYG